MSTIYGARYEPCSVKRSDRAFFLPADDVGFFLPADDRLIITNGHDKIVTEADTAANVEVRSVTPQKIEEVMSLFASEARQVYGSALREVILYGSCARGDFEQDSDIDIMVLLDVPQERLNIERKKIIDASDRLDMDYDVVLTPVFQSKKTFDRYLPASKFYQNVRTEGVRYA